MAYGFKLLKPWKNPRITLMAGNTSTAHDKLCMTGISSFPTPDTRAKNGDKRYIITAKMTPNKSMNFKNSRMRVKL